MLKRAWPKAQTPFEDDQRPRSSGPRWAIPKIIASTAPRFAGEIQFTSPAMPHMASILNKLEIEESEEYPSVQIGHPFDTPIGWDQPGAGDGHHDPDRQLHQQTDRRPSVHSGAKKTPAA